MNTDQNYTEVQEPAITEGEVDSGVINEAPVGEGEALPTEDSGSEQVKVNPAWAGLLENIPAEFHNTLIPEFKSWDSNYQKGIEKARTEVQSKYEPYQQFLDNNVDPGLLNNAYGLYQKINEDPSSVIEALIQATGYQLPNQGQQQAHTEESNNEEYYDPSDITQHPKFKELQTKFEEQSQNFQNFMQAFEEQAQKEAEQKQIQEYQNQIETDLGVIGPKFKEQYGFDMDAQEVLRRAIQNLDSGATKDIDLNRAASEFAAVVNKYRTPPGQNTPTVMAPGGGIPQQPVDYAKMDSDSREAMVAKILASQNK